MGIRCRIQLDPCINNSSVFDSSFVPPGHTGMHLGVRLHRNLWGLTVRCERTLRAVIPNWEVLHNAAGLGVHVDYLLRDNRPQVWLEELCLHLQHELAAEASAGKARSGSFSDAGRLWEPGLFLCEAPWKAPVAVRQPPLGGGSNSTGVWLSERVAIPLLHLLTSHMATAAKIAQQDINFCKTFLWHSQLLMALMRPQPSQVSAAAAAAADTAAAAAASLQRVLAAAAPSMVAFLLPRCAALSANTEASDMDRHSPAVMLLHSMAFVYVCGSLGARLSLQVISLRHMFN